MAKFKQTDRLWGIERDRLSLAFGTLVVGGENQGPIFLWTVPNAKVNPENMTGALMHNHKVEVLNSTKIDDRMYYKVRADVMHEGKPYRQQGWISAALLKKRGAPDYDEDNGTAVRIDNLGMVIKVPKDEG